MSTSIYFCQKYVAHSAETFQQHAKHKSTESMPSRASNDAAFKAASDSASGRLSQHAMTHSPAYYLVGADYWQTVGLWSPGLTGGSRVRPRPNNTFLKPSRDLQASTAYGQKVQMVCLHKTSQSNNTGGTGGTAARECKLAKEHAYLRVLHVQ